MGCAGVFQNKFSCVINVVLMTMHSVKAPPSLDSLINSDSCYREVMGFFVDIHMVYSVTLLLVF